MSSCRGLPLSHPRLESNQRLTADRPSPCFAFKATWGLFDAYDAEEEVVMRAELKML